MTAIDPKPTHRNPMIWLAVVLALIAAIAYMLIGFHVLAVGDLQDEERPAAIIYVAASCYLVGGLLILLQRRWLWVTGAVINALVMLVFVRAYFDRPAVLFSPGGVTTKAAQLLLEVSLLVLIVAGWHRSRTRAATSHA